MMKLLSILLLLLAVPVHAPLQAQDKKPTTMREVLLAKLRSTHTNAEWFVPASIAVKGLTAEQASWTDGKGNHWERIASFLESDTPVAVTRRGETLGVYVPTRRKRPKTERQIS
jgi:hypothetical protein